MKRELQIAGYDQRDISFNKEIERIAGTKGNFSGNCTKQKTLVKAHICLQHKDHGPYKTHLFRLNVQNDYMHLHVKNQIYNTSLILF